MGQTNISIRIDEDLKLDAEALFSKLGLTLSSATNIFYRQAVMRQMIPFILSVKHKHIPLKERLKGFDGVYEFEEWDTGEDVGREIINDL